MSGPTINDVTDATESITRREARGFEARVEAAQTVSIALGGVEVSHVGKRLLIALATEHPTLVLTATQVLILIGDDGETWPVSQWTEFHRTCNGAILTL